MPSTVAGTFDTREAAHDAVRRLRDMGVPADDISMIARHEPGTDDRVPLTATNDTDRDRLLQARHGEGAGVTINPPRAGTEPVLATRVDDDDEVEAVENVEYSTAATGAATGGLIGGVGGLLLGLGALAIPGLGPVLAAGPIAAALGGAAIGAATGGLVGAVIDVGIPVEYANTYATDVERGQVLVTVRTDDASQAEVREAMARAGALNIYPPAGTLV